MQTSSRVHTAKLLLCCPDDPACDGDSKDSQAHQSRPYIGRRFPKHVVFCGIPVVPCKVVRCSKGHATISCNSGTSSRWCVPLPAGLSPRFRKTTDGSSTTAGSFAAGVSPAPTFSPLPQVEAGTHTSLATTDVRQSFAFHARLLLRCWAG